MRRSLVAGFVLFVLAGAPAAAQLAKGAVMSAAELRTGLFGIEMSGYSPSYGFSWRECIQPNGETLYETPDGVVNGRLTISNGQACFAYEDDGFATPACYVTRKIPSGFRFEGDFDSLFITTKVVTGIRTCKPSDLVG